jgi:hypothetical protein
MKRERLKIVIESGIECPDGMFPVNGTLQGLRKALKKMKPGQSFMWDDNALPYHAASSIGIKVKTRKISGLGYRVWKLKS